MALTVTEVTKVAIPLTGGQAARVFAVTGDASIAAGGESLTAADLGFTTVRHVQAPVAGGYAFSYDYTNSKLQAWRDAGAAAAMDEADTVDLSAVTTRILVIGEL